MSMPHHLELTREGFSTRSDEVFAAKAAAWYATTPFGIAVLRRREAGQLLRDRRLRQGSHDWPSLMGLSGPFAEFWANSVIAMEGARHKALRGVIQRALSLERIEGLVPAFREIAEGLIGGAGDRFDFMEAFATPFAGKAICIVFDLPPEIWADVARDASTLGLAMGLDAKRNEHKINAATLRLYDLAEAALSRPGNPIAHAANGEVSRDDVLNAIVITIFGGVDTTRAQLGLGMAMLADHPDVWASLYSDPCLIPEAIEDFIRLRPTTTWATREVIEDFEFSDLPLRNGQKVHILVHSSSADVEWAIDPTEKRPSHFGFGGGAHHCLGSQVARADMAVALAVLSEKLAMIRLDGAPRFSPEVGNTAPLKVPLEVTRRGV